MFARDLQSHLDADFASYIVRGLYEGFHVGFAHDSSTLRPQGSNHPLSMGKAEVVRTHIDTELAAGQLIGPITQGAQAHVQPSPIGLVPKGHTGDKWRLIVDLSSPRSTSVNNGISAELCSMKYASLDSAVKLIRQLGPGSQLVKMDVKDAYRIIPVHPEDQHLLAISWGGRTYVNRALPFGLQSAPKIFSAMANAMAWQGRPSRGEQLLPQILQWGSSAPPTSHRHYFVYTEQPKSIICACCEELTINANLLQSEPVQSRQQSFWLHEQPF